MAPAPSAPPPPGVTSGPVAEWMARIVGEINKVYVGQETLVRGVMAALLADGHVLIESVAGTAAGQASEITVQGPVRLQGGTLDLNVLNGVTLAAGETFDVLSFTPVGGAAPGTSKPAFDQQPIEAWAMADACGHAFARTGDPGGWRATGLAVEWFRGANDGGVDMYDARSGGGFDGLTATGVNPNQGAESTLAFVASRLLDGTRYAARSSFSRSVTGLCPLGPGSWPEIACSAVASAAGVGAGKTVGAGESPVVVCPQTKLTVMRRNRASRFAG